MKFNSNKNFLKNEIQANKEIKCLPVLERGINLFDIE